MQIFENIPLKNYLAMKIGGNARYMTDARSPQEVEEIFKYAAEKNLPTLVLGGGSNIIASDNGFNGIVVRIRIPGFELIADESNTKMLRIGAGENWDSVVKRSVDLSLSGIECMSGIPGTAGAAPIQNSGAYGQEIADTLEQIEAYDTQTGNFIRLKNEDCEFSYRNSIFKNSAAGRYVITYIYLRLRKSLPQPPFYDSLQKYLDENNIRMYTWQNIRNAVLNIRKDKLPDPDDLPNTGSFFKNPIIEEWQLNELRKIDENAPSYDMGDGKYKIPAGWLIENAGLKGQLINGMRIYDKNALVLVNESANSFSDLSAARDEIINKVLGKYNIQISQEPLQI